MDYDANFFDLPDKYKVKHKQPGLGNYKCPICTRIKLINDNISFLKRELSKQLTKAKHRSNCAKYQRIT